MKKIITSILLISYLAASAASALQLHYCEGRWMANINLIWVNSFDNNATCKQKDQLPDCCKHPEIIVKINHDQQVVNIFVLKVFHSVKLSIFPNAEADHPTFLKPFASSPKHSPPKWLAKINGRQAFYSNFLI